MKTPTVTSGQRKIQYEILDNMAIWFGYLFFVSMNKIKNKMIKVTFIILSVLPYAFRCQVTWFTYGHVTHTGLRLRPL